MRISYVQIFLGFLVVFTLSILFVGVCRKIAIYFEILDKPDSTRKVHTNPVPYLGGVGLILAFTVTLSIGIYIISPSEDIKTESINLLFPCLIMGIVGLWDDLKNLSAHFRLMVQVVLGLFCSISITFGSTSGNISNIESLNILFTIFWLVGITNAINFFDNYDGGAAIATLTTSIGMSIYSLLTDQLYLVAVNVVLIGALLGFFYWNRKPARVYMGDAGALFVGMLLASLAVRIDPVAPSKMVSLLVPVMFLAIPILDTTTVVICRLLNKRSPLQGGLDHLTHRLANLGMSYIQILLAIAIFGLQFQLIAIATIYANEVIGTILIGAFLFEVFYLLNRSLRIKVSYEL